MATHDYIISNASGAAVRADLNNALAAIATNNSSATEPTTTYAYQWWADTGSSPTVMKLRNAANSGWITLFQLDGEWTVVPFENGTAAAPSIYFKDSGTDTGIYSPGTDQVAITTGGTGRLFVTSSGSVGIGSSTPSALLSVYQSSAGEVANFGTSDPTRLLRIVTGTANSITGALITLKTDSAQGEIAFGTGGGSERARIDSSGRLLVNTTTSALSYAALQIKGGPSADSANICLASNLTAIASGNDIGTLQFTNQAGGRGAAISATSDGTWNGGVSHPSRLVFSTTADGASSPTERMRIRNTGQVWINQTANMSGTTDSVILQAKATGGDFVASLDNTNASGGYGLYIRYTGGTPNNTANQFLYCQDTGSVRAEIRSNGGLANYSANNANLSDINTKKDISPAAGTWDCIKEWEIVNYRYKDQPDDADLNLGVIAQQVAESCPEVITVFSEAKEATEDQPAQEERLGIKEQQMYWMAIKALQEAQLRIEQLEAKVAALEAN